MRLIHTADWHLGRILFGVHLTVDQAVLLDGLVDLLRDTRPHALLISGDIYDRAVPPPEAVRLLDDFLSRVMDLSIPVVMIAGNHDSPDRLGFGSRILERQGIFVRGPVSPAGLVTTLEDESGPVHICALPYGEPSVVREHVPGDISDHHSAMAARLTALRNELPEKGRAVLLAHAFVAGSSESESERPLSVGGSAAVSPDLFEGFDYVALGHLHRNQTAGSDRIRYSGSIMPYSFSESIHPKAVNLVTLDGKGQITVETVALSPRRGMRIVEGFLDAILADPPGGAGSDDYIQVTLHDDGPVLDALGRLRRVFPNLLHIERPHLARTVQGGLENRDHRKMDDADLFARFYADVTGQSLTPSMAGHVAAIVEQVRQKEREVQP